MAPLLAVVRQLTSSTRPADARFDPDDFMDFSWCRRDRPPGISVFKHVHTRRYLYLDTAGHAYRYDPPPPGRRPPVGTYRRHATLAEAIDDLSLSEAVLGEAG